MFTGFQKGIDSLFRNHIFGVSNNISRHIDDMRYYRNKKKAMKKCTYTIMQEVRINKSTNNIRAIKEVIIHEWPWLVYKWKHHKI
jgi:hypothetical protein